MIHKLLDKLTETLRPKESILLLACYETAKMEWTQRSELVKGIIAFSAPEDKSAKLATDRLHMLGFLEYETRVTGLNTRHKFIRVTRGGQRFLTQAKVHSQS